MAHQDREVTFRNGLIFRRFDDRASIVFIGVGGAGKKSLAFIAACGMPAKARCRRQSVLRNCVQCHGGCFLTRKTLPRILTGGPCRCMSARPSILAIRFVRKGALFVVEAGGARL